MSALMTLAAPGRQNGGQQMGDHCGRENQRAQAGGKTFRHGQAQLGRSEADHCAEGGRRRAPRGPNPQTVIQTTVPTSAFRTR